MSTPVRTLRNIADEVLHRDRNTTFKESDREQKILDVAECLMIRCGRGDITMTALCSAMMMSPLTVRRQFADMEEVLSAILLRHLNRLSAALAKLSPDDPGPDQQKIARAKRAAYLSFTRTPFGAHTDIHHLLLSEGPSLPPDLASTVENTRRALAATLFGPGAHRTTLALLDSLDLDCPGIERMLATLETLLRTEAPAAAEPAATPIPLHRSTKAPQKIKEPAGEPGLRNQSPEPPAKPHPTAEARAGPG